ncbi:hypothetical protein GGF42_003144 [Coemansia sp. RSA 2424]|nr:hypothetical protein GGF42_003144 [Coemansia sp. RSA 2424]
MRFVQSLVMALAAGLSVAMAEYEAPDLHHRLFRRADTNKSTTASDVSGFKGAVLLKNGQQTSCEVALMRNTYGFVAASCIGFVDSEAKAMNQSTIYEVAITAGNQVSYGTVLVSKITVNPRYDSKTFANNLAVLEFSSNGGRYEFVNYIASWRPDWSSMYYVRRSLINGGGNNVVWNAPVVVPYTESSGDIVSCARVNKLFLSNQKDMMCNQMSTPSAVNATCSAPFGSVYGVNGANIAIAALYSHSAISGGNNSSMCSSSNVHHYYTVMENYVHWAMSVLKTRVPVYHSRVPEYTENMDPNYSMTIPQQPIDINGITVVSGDIYHIKVDTEEVAAKPSKEASKSSNGGGPSVVVIVAIVLGLLIFLALAAYFYRKRQKSKMGGGSMSRVRTWWLFGRLGSGSGSGSRHSSQGPSSYY